MKVSKISLLLILIALFLGPVALVVFSIPFGEISELKDNFVKVSYRDDNVEYALTKSRPSSWVSFARISPHVANAIVISEDWGFYQHAGIDWNQLEDALQDHFEKGEGLRGASTITQQLVKNLFLSSERSYWRKIKEAVISLYLETQLSKKRILEIYLNIIEYGKGIYGISGASHHYFGKAPLTLTPRESAFLAMLLPSPEKYAISYRQKVLTPYAEMMIHSILGKMKMAHYLTQEEVQAEIDSNFSWEENTNSLFLQL